MQGSSQVGGYRSPVYGTLVGLWSPFRRGGEREKHGPLRTPKLHHQTCNRTLLLGEKQLEGNINMINGL
jgi:hypothetical protein